MRLFLQWLFMTWAFSCVGTCAVGMRVQATQPAPVTHPETFEVAVRFDGGVGMVPIAQLDAFFATHPEHALLLRDEDVAALEKLLEVPGAALPAYVSVQPLDGGAELVTLTGQSFDDTPKWTKRYIAREFAVEPLEDREEMFVPSSVLAVGMPYYLYVVGVCGVLDAAYLAWRARRRRLTSR